MTLLHYIVSKGKVMEIEREAGVTVFTAPCRARLPTSIVYEIIIGRKSVEEVFRERPPPRWP